MRDADIAQALGEVDGILKAANVRDVVVLTVDTQVAESKKVMSGAEVQVMGRGGTDMRVGIQAVSEMKEKPNVTIVLTDGETPWPDKKPEGMNIIAGIIGKMPEDLEQSSYRPPDFIETVAIPVTSDAPAPR